MVEPLVSPAECGGEFVSHTELEKIASFDRVQTIRESSIFEWLDVGDFVYKSKSSIDQEKKIEQGKIDSYFPAGIDERTDNLRRLRAERAAQRLEHTYPYMLATGNFYAVLSLLEAFILLLTKETSVLFDQDYRDAAGMGLEKMYNHLRGVGIDLNKAKHYQAISSAFTFRNCLIHCGGVLQLSREREKIKRILSQRQHLSGVARQNSKNPNHEVNNIAFIGDGNFGERLLINNDYAYAVSCYASEYFSSVGAMVIARFLETHSDNSDFEEPLPGT